MIQSERPSLLLSAATGHPEVYVSVGVFRVAVQVNAISLGKITVEMANYCTSRRRDSRAVLRIIEEMRARTGCIVAVFNTILRLWMHSRGRSQSDLARSKTYLDKTSDLVSKFLRNMSFCWPTPGFMLDSLT